jgi:hypothetical protein
MTATQKSPKKKPTVQSIGVSSIDAGEIGTIGGTSYVHNWPRLCSVPKFQTYAFEQCKQPYDQIEKWIEQYAITVIHEHGEQFLYDSYMQWHNAQGHWKNEDAYGNILELEV